MTSDLPSAFWQGVEQFNQGQFYACHDTLEALWMEAADPPKSLYQGILQIAVALYHLSNCNWRGAVILLGEGMSRLRPYQPDYASINIEDLLEQTTMLLSLLQQTEPAQVAQVAFQLGLLNADEAAQQGMRPDTGQTLDVKLPKISLI